MRLSTVFFLTFIYLTCFTKILGEEILVEKIIKKIFTLTYFIIYLLVIAMLRTVEKIHVTKAKRIFKKKNLLKI